MTGLPVKPLEALSEMGILMPVSTPEGRCYDGLDLRVARAAAAYRRGVGMNPPCNP
ncbi:MAG TPA: hypothetical protein VJ436_10145 [Anaerolineales bacterium]|nr:hypothetical protein [Anaerolineales bacterium]